MYRMNVCSKYSKTMEKDFKTQNVSVNVLTKKKNTYILNLLQVRFTFSISSYYNVTSKIFGKIIRDMILLINLILVTRLF